MVLIRFIWKTCRGMMIFMAVAALLSGAANAGFLAMVTVALNQPNHIAAAERDRPAQRIVIIAIGSNPQTVKDGRAQSVDIGALIDVGRALVLFRRHVKFRAECTGFSGGARPS